MSLKLETSNWSDRDQGVNSGMLVINRLSIASLESFEAEFVDQKPNRNQKKPN